MSKRPYPACSSATDFVSTLDLLSQPLRAPWGTVGTRSQTVVVVRRDGSAELRERYRCAHRAAGRAVQSWCHP